MEKKNQKAFEGMVFDLISQWDNIQFELDRHNQSQVFLISQRSAEKILDLVADQRAKIRKEIETEQEFKQKLDRIQDITDAWIDTQKRFLCCALFLTGQLKQRVENLYERFLVEQGRYQSMISTCLKDPRVVSFCEVPEILSDFRDMRINFELIASQCDNHLNDARIAFPRFFFVSNEQLIEMLSMRGIKEFKRFYKLLFDSVDALELDEKQNVKGMTSIQSEYVPWPRTLVWSDSQISLESQLSDIEILMREAVRYHIKMARRTYPESDRKQWVLNWPSMAVLCVTQIYWTFEAAQAISDDEGKALTDYYRKCNEQLEEIVLMLRGSLSDLLRQSIGTLVVTEVHARDSTRMLIEENVSSLAEFAWMAQLRYYWEEENVLCGMMRARRKYGYEYLGVESRVLGTPLTDRCYRTLMCALQLNIGGSLEGPAGTGKSETVKGLAQCFAVRVTTINCSDGLDCMFTSKMLKGAAYCGCWICFDEFNRIDIEIMSIIALQVLHIQRAWKSQTSEIVFEGSCLKLNHGYAIFSTLNPEYAGGTHLPDSLKALFRPVQMSMPDYAPIVEIYLIKSGFIQAAMLARKLDSAVNVSKQHLSSQSHYDFGLRIFSSVLNAARKFKLLYPLMQEENIILWGLRQIVTPRLIAEDLALFDQIMAGLFPGVEQPQHDHTHLLSAFSFACEHHQITPSHYFSHKALELYEILAVNHSALLVGGAYGGKTSGYVALADALCRMSIEGQNQERKVQVSVLNPSSVEVSNLFGRFDAQSSAWRDGIFGAIFRRLNSDPSLDRKWLVIDGHVDCIWAENINSVTDCNKMLCLANGDTIKMQSNVRLLFEVGDLDYASPAFVSRSGIVFYDSLQMGLDTFQTAWLRNLPEVISISCRKHIHILFEQMVPLSLEFLRKEALELYPTSDHSLVWTLMKIFDLLIRDITVHKHFANSCDEAATGRLEGIFLFSLIWSIGCTIDSFGREKFDAFIRNCSGGNQITCWPQSRFPDTVSVFQFRFDAEKSEWYPWLSLHTDPLPSSASASRDIFVHTSDTVIDFYWMKIHSECTWTQCTRHKMALLMVGPTAGKTTVINRYLSTHLDRKCFSSFSLSLTEHSSSRQIQEAVELHLEKRQEGIYGPSGGKQCMLFVDDVNCCSRQVYGSQPVIELLRQHFCQGGWFDLDTSCFRGISDLNLVCAMGEADGSRPLLSPRFVRWFHLLGIVAFDDEALFGIYSAVANVHANRMGASIIFKEFSIAVVKATCQLYSSCVEAFRPSPLSPHYIFKTSCIGRIVLGTASINCPTRKEEVVLLWMHEASREIFDRLITDSDRKLFEGYVELVTKETFSLDFGKLTEHLSVPHSEDSGISRLEQLLYGDFSDKEKGSYLPFKSPDEALKQVDYFLKKIDITASIPFPIILFSYMIQHTIHVCRVLRAAGGNALLLGSTGSGKRTCTKLAACMLDIMVIEIEPDSCRYEKSDWSESIKRAVRSAGSEMKSTVVFFADRRIQTQNILADIGQILKKSAIKSLFTDQEIAHLMVKTDKSIVAESDADYWESFQEQCSCNLHFVVSLKAEGAELAHMLLNNQFLLSSCTVQWFAEFPSDSYRSIAAALIPRSLLDKGTWGACQEGSARMHTSAVEISHTFSSQPTRFAHVTPILFFDFMHHFTLLLRKQLEGLNFQLQRCHDAIEILTRAHNWADSVNSQSTDSSGISDVQDQSFKLASFVSKEISRWKGVETVLNLKKANAFGDILLAAGFITYMGVFSAQYRDMAIASWTKILDTCNIKRSTQFDLTTLMADVTTIQGLIEQGLEPVPHSIHNSIILAASQRSPYCIDPQGQASKWIQKMESKNDLRLIRSEDPQYLSMLQRAKVLHQPVLLEQESGDLDPALDGFLHTESWITGQAFGISSKVSKDFRLYVVTKVSCPSISPSTTAKVKVLNFVVTEEGLGEQLLRIICMKEHTTLESQKQFHARSMTEWSRSLIDVEDRVINLLSRDEGKFFGVGDEIAPMVEKVSVNLEEMAHHERELAKIQIETGSTLGAYQGFAKRISLVFFSMVALSKVNVMYQYSLSWFVSLFTQFILSNADASGNISESIASLEQNCLQFFLKMVSRSLYEEDRLLFTFLLCLRLHLEEGKMQEEELQFLVKENFKDNQGNQSSPFPWLPDKSWQRILRASVLQSTARLSDDYHLHQNEWRAFVESPDPWHMAMPGSWDDCSPLARLLIVSAVRPEKMFSAIKCFVNEGMGQQLMDTGEHSLADCLTDSNPCTPIIIIFSSGVDPSPSVFSLSSRSDVSTGFKSLVLGQGQGLLARTLISEACKGGGWVLLQDCHLYPSWMPTLERICHDFEPGAVNTDFRLWLTTQVSGSFPVSVLKSGLKIIFESPSGLRNNLKQCISSKIAWDGKDLTASKNEVEFKRLTLALGLFHGMLLERQGYGLQGWNIPYKFSIDDLNISSIQVKAVLENDEANYFRILHYIIGECFYGGKVKDEQDRRYLLQALADSIRTDNSLNERLGTIAVSSNIVRGNFSLQDLNSFIDQFPETCHAEYLGLHENADMQKELRSSDRIFQKMFSTDIFWSEVNSRAESKLIESELMQDTCEMLALLPLQFDEDQVQRAFPFASNESLNIVLIREVKRFNMLTKRISSTLISLRDAVQGLKTMSADDEDALKTMKIGNIPPKWLRISYASNRRLAAYFSNLLLRIDFLKTWVKDGQPITFWMSAFFSPSAFLTAVQHNYARKWSISLCDLAFNHSVLNEEETKSCPGDGVYVDGLFCEACRWNSGQGRLDEAQRGVLSSPLPTVWFKPKAQLPQNTNWQEEEIDGDGRPVAVGIYDCPVYTTSHIQNRLLLCHVSLATSMPKSHWIRRGASLIPDMEH